MYYKMKYIMVEWPEIQDYMNNIDYPEKCYFDPEKNVWFIPEDWGPNDLGLGDLEDAMG